MFVRSGGERPRDGEGRGARGERRRGVRGKGARMECTALHRVLTPSGRRGCPLLLLLCGEGAHNWFYRLRSKMLPENPKIKKIYRGNLLSVYIYTKKLFFTFYNIFC